MKNEVFLPLGALYSGYQLHAPLNDFFSYFQSKI